jgi:hypothetical protein
MRIVGWGGLRSFDSWVERCSSASRTQRCISKPSSTNSTDDQAFGKPYHLTFRNPHSLIITTHMTWLGAASTFHLSPGVIE